MPATRSLAKDHTLLVLCDLSYKNQDAVEVAIVSTFWRLTFCALSILAHFIFMSPLHVYTLHTAVLCGPLISIISGIESQNHRGPGYSLHSSVNGCKFDFLTQSSAVPWNARMPRAIPTGPLFKPTHYIVMRFSWLTSSGPYCIAVFPPPTQPGSSTSYT